MGVLKTSTRIVLLFSLAAIFCTSPSNTAERTGAAQGGDTGFQTGQLAAINNALDITDSNGKKAAYLFKVQNGSDTYYGRYAMTYFEHDHAKQLKAGDAIQYKVDKKYLYLKTKEGAEIKARLCKERGNCVVCGGSAFCGLH
jgi:hypothetical protein